MCEAALKTKKRKKSQVSGGYNSEKERGKKCAERRIKSLRVGGGDKSELAGLEALRSSVIAL
jgi:hypothetical protein